MSYIGGMISTPSVAVSRIVTLLYKKSIYFALCFTPPFIFPLSGIVKFLQYELFLLVFTLLFAGKLYSQAPHHLSRDQIHKDDGK